MMLKRSRRYCALDSALGASVGAAFALRAMRGKVSLERSEEVEPGRARGDALLEPGSRLVPPPRRQVERVDDLEVVCGVDVCAAVLGVVVGVVVREPQLLVRLGEELDCDLARPVCAHGRKGQLILCASR